MQYTFNVNIIKPNIVGRYMSGWYYICLEWRFKHYKNVIILDSEGSEECIVSSIMFILFFYL